VGSDLFFAQAFKSEFEALQLFFPNMKSRSIDFGGPNLGDYASEVLVLYPSRIKTKRDGPWLNSFLISSVIGL
jgi:hypothetical protein